MSPRSVSGPLTPGEVRALEAIAQHRLLSTNQLRAIRGPSASGRGTQELLAGLELRTLIAHTRAGGALKVWRITERGADLALTLGTLAQPPKLLSAAEASGALHAHTLHVNDVGICFLAAARERGDEFGPLSWRHEIAHPYTATHTRRRGKLFADAILTYLTTAPRSVSLQYRFLELDRATLTIDRLAAKLARYASLYRYAPRGANQPAWRSHYPAFPAVLCVLANGPRRALERRRRAVIALCRTDAELARTPQVIIAVALLDDLQAQGPFAPIFIELADPESRVDWLGTPTKEAITP